MYDIYFQYSSRDEVISSSSDSKQTPRFGSLSSPSSYRPSYSGGTYRSIGIKRDTPASTSSYSSRWLTPNKENSTKESTIPRKSSTKTTTNEASNSTENKPSKSVTGSTSGSLLNKTKTREQSTAIRPTVTVAKVRIRDVGSSNSSYSASKSRDPSPCEPVKDRYTSSSGYVSSSYSKLYPRSSNKLQVNSYHSRSTSPAVSYLNGSDVGGRYRQNVEDGDKSPKTSSENKSPVKEIPNTTKTVGNGKESPPADQKVEMIEVTVVTRATSPNLCSTSTTNFSRCRRVEIAKTVEKTIMRPKHKIIGEDKEIQSDRMDDTSKYCRFNSTRPSTAWPSYVDSKYNSMSYTRINSGSNSTSLSRYSSASRTEKDSSESSPEKSPEKSPSKSRESSISKSPSISRSNSIKSVTKSEKSKSKSPPVPSTKSTSSSPTKQRIYNNKTLPPQPPKLESPTKTISSSAIASSANSTSSKWANKDFRKSALNVGQTDRPRKTRSSSSNTDNEDSKKMQQKSSTNQISFTRSDRSPSVSSESSSSNAADDIARNFMKLKISPTQQSTTATTIATETVTTEPTNLDEVMHLNSDVMTCELKSTPNCGIQNQTNEILQSNESCPKADNTQSNIVNRVFGPVMKIFKTKSQHFGESQSVSDHENAISINDTIKQDTLIESALNETTITTTNGTKLVNSNNYLADESSWINSTINEQTTDTQFDKFQSKKTLNMKNQLAHIESNNQLPWWLNEGENDDTVAEDITLNQSDNETTRIHGMDMVDMSQTNSSIKWWMSDEPTSQSDTGQKYRITHIRSGERAWWLDEDTEESVNDILEAAENENDVGSKFTFKIKKIESGERAWWLCEENKDSSPVKSSNRIEENLKDENGEDVDFWATINESIEKQQKEAKQLRKQNQVNNMNYQYDINANYIPLGDRSSPEGLEDLNNSIENRLSPYDNVGANNVESCFKRLFISRHRNIDDVLGVPCRTLSPFRLDNDDNKFEEILPSQVRIHEGIPKQIHTECDRCVILFDFNFLYQ